MTDIDTDTRLRRFHGLLVAALRDRGEAALERPFTVAEIYQDLVPYRRHRDDLAVDMNGDYEHLLLRLLVGEGEFVRLDSESALRAIRKELQQPNPNTGVYRDYAAADVHILDPEIQPVPEARVSPAPDVDDHDSATPRVATRTGDDCPWCAAALPDRPGLRFCPHCGSDVHSVPCASCQEPLEPGWRFCVRCGEPVGAG